VSRRGHDCARETTEQVWNADVYRTNARFVRDLGMPILELLAPRAGERTLDLGCGDAVLTKKLQDMAVRSSASIRA
jgi:trans-aconitate methyltransferase